MGNAIDRDQYWHDLNLDYAEPPEEFEECPDCLGEGGYERAVWVNRHCGFGHYDGEWVTCETCRGRNIGFICEASGLSMFDLEERCGG